MKNFRLKPTTKLDEKSGIIGLDGYLKSLEKDYFANVSLRNYNSNEFTVEMTIDIQCHLSLLEMLAFFTKSRWGFSGGEVSALKKSFNALTELNTIKLDIEELTLLLDDTSIIIKKIYNQSIPDQLNEILSEISNHYIYFSKGLTEKPYEIFVPVFEDCVAENEKDHSLFHAKEKTPKSYFEFWGVYLESQEDALIYDVSKNAYIPADLDFYMLD